MGGGPTGVASGTVGGAGSNKKPRSRTKVPMVVFPFCILLCGFVHFFI